MALVCNASVYLTKTTSMAAALNAVTTMCWVKVANAPASVARIMSPYRNGSANCSLLVNSSRQIFAENGVASGTGTTVLALNTWYHVAMTGLGEVYIDGVLEMDFASGPFDGETTRYFGGDSVFPLDGKVAYARVWDANLTSGQIATEKASTTAVVTTNLLEDSAFISSTPGSWTVNNGPASYDSDDPLAGGGGGWFNRDRKRGYLAPLLRR